MHWFSNSSSSMNRHRCGTSDLPRSKHRLRLRHYAWRLPKLWLRKTGTTSGSSMPMPIRTRCLCKPSCRLRLPNCAEADWPIARRLWMIPRQSWLPDDCGHRITDQNLSRLRELTSEFDFSILWCAPVSWLTASVGQTCDGLVLVLTANKTRRLVAAQIKDQLSKAKVPLLGTVLAERRFPVPQGLYRSL